MIWTLLALALTLPNPTLTPGATRPVTVKEICTPGSAAIARDVTPSVKAEVYARYHIARSGTWVRSKKTGKRYFKSDYEVDHLISIEIGGSNEIENLWAQSYTGPLNAHDKDRLENQLHALVCKGSLTLKEAQTAMRTDWTKALTTYGGKAGPR